MQKINTFEEACKALGCSNDIPSFEPAPDKHKKALVAHYKLILIAEAINDGWQPDWGSRDQYKYQLWPNVDKDNSKPSGFGLSYGVCADWCTDSSVGSRLCFRSREAARYCLETFKELWEDYFLIPRV